MIGVSRMGPFKDQEEAAQSVMLADNKGPAPGAFVWPEKVIAKKRSAARAKKRADAARDKRRERG